MPLNVCGLQAAESNRASLRFIKEDNDCWGVTPASGTSREMRITSSALVPEKETVISNELRADRMVSDVVEVAAQSGGDINVEFSAGSLDDFLEAFLLGTWTRPMTFDKWEGALVSWTGASTIVVAGLDVSTASGYLTAGRHIKTEGFLLAANNGYWTISTATFGGGNTTITVTQSIGVVETGTALCSVRDANDVTVIRDVTIQAGTGSINVFESDGNDAFATAVAAGQLVVGQKIFVQGLGYEVGSVTCGLKETALLTMIDNTLASDTITLDDGIAVAHVITWDTEVTVGGTFDESAANLVTYINGLASATLNMSASYSTPVVTITNNNLTAAAVTDSSAAVSDASITLTADFGADVVAIVNPTDADTVTVFDGEKTVVFEFDDDSSFVRGRIGVDIHATDGNITAGNLRDAMMQTLWNGKYKVKAELAADGSKLESNLATLTNINPGEVGDGTIAESSTACVAVDFTGGNNDGHGFFTLTAVADDVLTVSEDVAVITNTTVEVTIKGSHVRNPGDLADIIAQSFTVEQGFTDVNQYMIYTGMRVGSFSLALSAGEIVTGTLTLMGKETSTASTSLIGSAPYLALATTASPVLNATVNVGDVYKDGVVLSSALQSIEINGESALRNQPAVSSKFPAGIGTGRFNLTGSMTAYFETLEMFDHFLNHDSIGLAFDFLDNDFNSYWFTIPALKITTDPIAPGGIDQDVLEEMEFVAFRSSTLNTQFMVDRFSSTLPL